MAADIGLISDTHALLRPSALDALQGCDFIVHAGDIGDASILHRLQAIAPLTVVRGNNDKAAWADAIPETATLTVEGKTLFVLHDLKQLDLDPAAAGMHAVVSGHSHRPAIQRRGDVLYINPGSAGPRRFSLPIAVARLRVDRDIEARIVELAG